MLNAKNSEPAMSFRLNRNVEKLFAVAPPSSTRFGCKDERDVRGWCTYSALGTPVLTLTNFGNHIAVTADGQPFLINTTIEEIGTSPISVVVNWTGELTR